MKMDSQKLAAWVLRGMGLGLAMGGLARLVGQGWPPLLEASQMLAGWVLEPLGQVFLRLLFFVIIPLVFSSLASGVLQLGRLDRMGPLAGRTFFLFVSNMALAVFLGLLLMNYLRPGETLDPETRSLLLAEYGGGAQKQVAASANLPAFHPQSLVDMFMPKNLLNAFVGPTRGSLGDVLPLILFAFLCGVVGTSLGEEKRLRLLGALELVSELMIGIVHVALRLAPFAVGGLLFSVVVKTGLGIFVTLGSFVLGCVGVMFFHLFGVMALWLKGFTRRSPWVFFKEIKAVLVTAFSTSSSSATLPLSLACARETLGVRPSIAGFVLPLGATLNMSGTALYEGCTVLFVAQVFGVPLDFTQQAVLLVLAVLSAVAVAGIPGASLPLIAGLLSSFGIPAEGIGIVLGVDRLLDMARTTVNVGCDLVTAVILEERAPPES